MRTQLFALAALLCLFWSGIASAQNALEVETVVVSSDATEATVVITADIGADIRGVAFAILYDSAELLAIDIEFDPEFEQATTGAPGIPISSIATPGEVTGVVLLTDEDDRFLPSTGTPVCTITFSIDGAAPSGALLETSFGSTVTADTEFVLQLMTGPVDIAVDTVDGGVIRLASPPTSALDSLIAIPTADGLELRNTDLLDIASSTPLASPPFGVALAENGVYWVTLPSADEVVRIDTTGALVGSAITIPGARNVATDLANAGWIGADAAIWHVSAGGEILRGDAGLVSGPIERPGSVRALAADRNGAIWGINEAGTADDGALFRLSSDGDLQLETALDVQPESDLSIDSAGFVWVSLENSVRRFRSDGTVADEFFFDGDSVVGALAIRAATDAWALVIDLDTQLGAYRLTPGSPPELFLNLESVAPTGIGAAGEGEIVVLAGESVYRFDPEDGPIDLADVPDALVATLDATAAARGDLPGLHLAEILHPDLDFDEDGVSNLDEAIARSDPYEATSAPAVFPVSDLTCDLDDATVTLSWTLPSGESSVSIERNDEFVAVVSLPDTTYSETLDPGLYRYSVRTSSGADSSTARECRVTVGAGALRNTFSVSVAALELGIPTDVALVPDATPGEVACFVSYPSGIVVALDDSGECVSFFDAPFESPSGLTYVTFGDDGSGSLLIANGALESSGEIAEISRTGEILRSAVVIPEIASRISNLSFALLGSDDGRVLATEPTDCEIWSLLYSTLIPDFAFPHPGETTGGTPGQGAIDVVTSRIVGDVGDEEIEIELLITTEDTAGGYEAGLYLVTADAVAPVVATIDPIVTPAVPLFAPGAFENVFTGISFRDTATLGVEENMTVLVAGETTGQLYSLEYQVGPLFLRGDVNSDGIVFPIIDALDLLEWGFTGGPAPECLAAADADSTGDVFAILDALYLLSWGFTGGLPPAAPGPFICGPDPTPLLSCEVAPSCP